MFPYFCPGQTWTLTMMRLMMQAKELEAGEEPVTADLIFRIPYIEAEVCNDFKYPSCSKSLHPNLKHEFLQNAYFDVKSLQKCPKMVFI